MHGGGEGLIMTAGQMPKAVTLQAEILREKNRSWRLGFAGFLISMQASERQTPTGNSKQESRNMVVDGEPVSAALPAILLVAAAVFLFLVC